MGDAGLRLYVVTVQLEMMVLAESRDEAAQICREQKAAREELLDADYFVTEAGTGLVGGWQEDHFVYNALGEDITVEQAREISKKHPPDTPGQMTFRGDDA